jgi:asparagine synthase (glutamine-hydrolysing)
MCGIAGIFHYAEPDRPIDRNLLEAMTLAIEHRGPDAAGIHIDGPIGLGHRRLSIVDLSETGAQPMRTSDGSGYLVYNGEFYNHAEFRGRLEQRGVRFRGSSDTETLLYLLREYGQTALQHAAGIFGFAYWDARGRKLTLARDPLGVKQVYYHDDGRRLLFASEIKALLADPSVRREADPLAVSEYLHFHTPLFERTFFKGIRQVRAGECMTFGHYHSEARTYWQIDDFEKAALGTEAHVEELASRINRVVKDQLMADVPVAAFFSGGIDSTAVAAFASRNGSLARCFGVHFANQGVIDERPYQETAAKSLGLDLQLTTLDGRSFPEDMRRLLYFQDQPVIGPAMFPMHAVSQLAASQFKVCLGGQASDEVFGGYARYALARPLSVIRNWFAQSNSQHVNQVGGNLSKQLTQRKNISRLLRNVGNLQNWQSRYFESFAKVPIHLWKQLFDTGDLCDREHCRRLFEQETNLSAATDPADKIMQWDLRTYLTGLFQQDDRMSMSVSLESRVPLADPRLVKHAFKIPYDLKFRRGATKWILREAIADIVPEQVLNRVKVGFDTPVESWMRGRHAGFVRETLLSGKSLGRGLWNEKGIKHLVEHPDGAFWIDRVWKALNIEVWAETFLDSAPVTHQQTASPYILQNAVWGATAESGDQAHRTHPVDATMASGRGQDTLDTGPWIGDRGPDLSNLAQAQAAGAAGCDSAANHAFDETEGSRGSSREGTPGPIAATGCGQASSLAIDSTGSSASRVSCGALNLQQANGSQPLHGARSASEETPHDASNRSFDTKNGSTLSRHSDRTPYVLHKTLNPAAMPETPHIPDRPMLTSLVREVRELGLFGTAARSLWEFKTRSGLLSVTPKTTPPESGPLTRGLFTTPAVVRQALASNPAIDRTDLVKDAVHAAHGRIKAFGKWTADYGQPIAWHVNPLNGRGFSRTPHWSRIFGEQSYAGDIKMAWEAGRFPHFFHLARAAAFVPESAPDFAAAVASQITHFIDTNPVDHGVQWSSGQEVALRLLAWSFALDAFSHDAGPNHEHLRRIAAAHIAASAQYIEEHIEYAMRSVYNNHLISEAFGLLLSGLLIPECASAARWTQSGIEILDRQADRQFYADGAYISQSHNYQRSVLHIYLAAIGLLRTRSMEVPDSWRSALERSLVFLYAQQNELDGRLPNYGGNDGAMPLVLSTCEYGDFRPTLQAVSLATRGTRLYPSGPWDEMAVWLQGTEALDAPLETPARTSVSFATTGFHVLRASREAGGNFALFRCGSIRDRFSQIDMLHADVWWRGENVLVDSGTFLYNGPSEWHAHFYGTLSHNTVSVDGRDQMVHLRKFKTLYPTEAKLLEFEESGELAVVQGEHYGFRRYPGHCVHRRTILFDKQETWVVVDDILGEGTHAARLHWLGGDYSFDMPQRHRMRLFTPQGRFEVAVYMGDGNPAPSGVASGQENPPRGWLSRHYGVKVPAPSLAAVCEDELPLRFVTVLTPHGQHTVTASAETWTLEYDSGQRAITFNRDNPCVAFASGAPRLREQEVLQP